jgi:hypothetical protein
LISTNEVDIDQVVAAFGASYGAVSPDGEDHYPVVVRKIFEMDQRDPALTPSDLSGVGARTLVMASDDDIITLEHTLALYRCRPDLRPEGWARRLFDGGIGPPPRGDDRPRQRRDGAGRRRGVGSGRRRPRGRDRQRDPRWS